MGLSLGVKEGARIRIGEDPAAVVHVEKVSSKLVKISVTAGHLPQVFDIVATERKLILPNVYCQLGKVDAQGGQSYTRLVFEAPRSIPIERVP